MAIRMTLPAGPITAFRASTIVGIQGPAGPQGPAGGGASVTWANDLSSSTNTNQYVSGISGILGTGGAITIGDGVHNTVLAGAASAQSLAPQLTLAASNGWAGNSGGGATLFVDGGFGGSAAAGNNTGGAGGDVVVTGGYGGASTGTAANSNGGKLRLLGGTPGTGGSGAAGLYGDVFMGSNAAYKAFATDNAAGPGFGIGQILAPTRRSREGPAYLPRPRRTARSSSAPTGAAAPTPSTRGKAARGTRSAARRQ